MSPGLLAGANDANLRRIGISFAVLSGVDFECKALFAKVRNQGDHGTETIGIYMDVIPAGGVFTTSTAISLDNPFGCAPAGRVLETRISASGITRATFDVYAVDGTLNGTFKPASGPDEFVGFSCALHAGATGQKYEIIAVVDIHGDDLASCGPGQLISPTCFSALANDDPVTANNDDSVAKPRVQPPGP